MAYAIEKNVPVPAAALRETQKYDFGNMQVGDSFFVPEKDVEGDLAKARTTIYNAARKFGSTVGRKLKFHAAVVEEKRDWPNGSEMREGAFDKETVRGIRVWRLEDPVAKSE